MWENYTPLILNVHSSKSIYAVVSRTIQPTLSHKQLEYIYAVVSRIIQPTLSHRKTVSNILLVR